MRAAKAVAWLSLGSAVAGIAGVVWVVRRRRARAPLIAERRGLLQRRLELSHLGLSLQPDGGPRTLRDVL